MATRAQPNKVDPEIKFRETPTTEEIVKDAEAKKEKLPGGRMIVKTAVPGYMWDPEMNQRVEEHDTVVKPSRWLAIQIAAGKIVEVKE